MFVHQGAIRAHPGYVRAHTARLEEIGPKKRENNICVSTLLKDWLRNY
jgi:hypothetical protein